MFRHKHLPPSRQTRKNIANLTPMLSEDVVLNEEKFKTLLSRIKDACGEEEVSYQSHYFPLIQQLVKYVEMLPDSMQRFYSERGGLLEYALRRAEIALDLLRPHLLLNQEKKLSEEQSAWQFSLFSAALFHGIGKLYLDYTVHLFDSQGHKLKIWNPFLEPLIFPGGYYNFQVNTEPRHDFRRRLNSLLAERIMPISSFNWLATHPKIFETWLALLDEEVGGSRILEAILTRADYLLLSLSLEELLEKLNQSKAKTFLSFEQTTPDMATQAGLLFLQWLKNHLESGELSLNESPLSLSEEGLRLNEEVFKLFVKDHAQYKNWQAVQKGFLSLGFHDKNVNTAEILFAKFGIVLPAKAQFLNASTGKKTWLSALEIIHFVSKGAKLASSESIEQVAAIPKLSEKGVWQEAQDVAFLKPGQSYRG